jgi:hypothetical protein
MDESRFGDRLRRFCGRGGPLKHAFCCVALLLLARPAAAYRPFDSTDAAVADRGEIEIECGPVGYAVEGSDRFIVAPAAIFNFGLPSRWELVVEGKNFLQLDAVPQAGRQRVDDAAVSVKHVMKGGSLQNQRGASIALEMSLLLATAPGEHRLGSAFTGIVSKEWSGASLHVNEAVVLTHDHSWTTFSGVILEGPSRWRIRPAGELTGQPADHAFTALAGSILTVSEHLSLDTGFRLAQGRDARGREFRAGFTWGFATRRTDGPNQAPIDRRNVA